MDNDRPLNDVWITVQVGGESFTTLRSTLERLEYFRIRFSTEWKGDICLDRDPKAFRALLNHLRDPHYEFPLKYWPELEFFDPKSATIDGLDQTRLLPTSDPDIEFLPGPENTEGLISLIVNSTSNFLSHTLPNMASPFITPITTNESPWRSARRIPLYETLRFGLLADSNIDYFTGAELHLFLGDSGSVIDVIQKLSIYRGEQLISRFEHRELAALHDVFGKRRNVFRLLDLFGDQGTRIQSRRMLREKEHFADLRILNWEIDIDIDRVEAIWLVTTGIMADHMNRQIEADLVSLNYEFHMYPVMIRQQLKTEDSEYQDFSLPMGSGVLLGMFVLIFDSDKRQLVNKISLIIGDNVMFTQLGSEHSNGIYHLCWANIFDMGRAAPYMKIRIYSRSLCTEKELVVIGIQRHYNYNFKYAHELEAISRTTFSPSLILKN